MTLTEALAFWCESSVEVLKMAREFRKVDGEKDPMALLEKMKEIADVVKKLNDAHIAEVESLQQNPDGSLYDSETTAMILKGIMNDFRSVPVTKYLSNVNLIRRSRAANHIDSTGHGWIRNDWEHLTALDFFKANINRAVEKQPWLGELMGKLKLDLAEMLSFGMGSLVAAANGEESDDAAMGKVFGNYVKDKSSIRRQAEVMSQDQSNQCIGSWLDKLKCVGARAGHGMEKVISKAKRAADSGYQSSASLAENSDDELDENFQESDEDASVGHALALANDKRSEFKIGAGLTPAGIAALNSWCFGIVGKYHVKGLILPPFWTIVAIGTWITSVLVPSLVIGAVIIVGAAFVGSLFLAAALLSAPLWLTVLGLYTLR